MRENSTSLQSLRVCATQRVHTLLLPYPNGKTAFWNQLRNKRLDLNAVLVRITHPHLEISTPHGRFWRRCFDSVCKQSIFTYDSKRYRCILFVILDRVVDFIHVCKCTFRLVCELSNLFENFFFKNFPASIFPSVPHTTMLYNKKPDARGCRELLNQTHSVAPYISVFLTIALMVS